MKTKNTTAPVLPQKLYNTLMTKIRQALKNMSKTAPLSKEAIQEIRNAFYQVLLELFAYYNEFVRKDEFGDVSFDIKRFMQISNK